MEHDGYYQLGTIIRTHGVRGHVIIRLDVDDPSVYRKVEQVLLETPEGLVPYTVLGATLNQTFLNVSLDGIDDKDAADALVKSDVFLPLSQLPRLPGNRMYLHEIRGMEVVDAKAGPLGKVAHIYDLPEQPVAAVMVQGKEVLIPLVSAFIDRADKANNVLYLTLPEGLLDIYL